jgi:glycosyltransferase involved in cell wall biosynthesis
MKISVITPAHNAEPYLRQAIDSVLAQTYPAHEIIIVENGSTDHTARIANSFGPPVRVLSLPRKTWPAVARNAAAAVATGDWLAFLDADDWILPDKFQKQKQLAADRPSSALLYSAALTFQGGEYRPAPFTPPEKLWPLLRYCSPFEVASVMVRREAFDAVGGFNPGTRYIEDWELWLRLMEKFGVSAFHGLEEPLAVYRRTPGSISTNAVPALQAAELVVNRQVLRGTSGLRRHLLRRRILAFRIFDAAILLREQNNPAHLQFMLRSLLNWPFPGSMFPLRRYKVFASMLEKRCRSFLGGWPLPESGPESGPLGTPSDQ